MTVGDLLTALGELRAGRITVEQLIAACSAWSNEPTRPLADFLQPAPAVPLAEPASGVLSPPRDYRPPARRRTPPAGAGRSRTLAYVAAGVGLVALIGLAVGLGVVSQSNARLEAANADLERANAELTAKAERAQPPAERTPEPKADTKTDPVRDSTASRLGPAKTPEPAKGVRALEENLARLRQSAGPNDPRTVRAAAELGRALVEAGRPIEAIKLLEDFERRPVDHPAARAAAVILAHALWATGEADRAIEVCERVRDKLADNEPLIPEARLQAALACRAAGKWDKAKPLFLDHLVYARTAHGDSSRQAAEAVGWMAECLLKLGDAAGAEPLAREGVDLWTQRAPTDWPLFEAKSLLGEVLLDRKKPDQAEPLLTQGYEGLKARKDALPWDRRMALADAAGRLARLYEAAGEKAKAAEWKKVKGQEQGRK